MDKAGDEGIANTIFPLATAKVRKEHLPLIPRNTQWTDLKTYQSFTKITN
jgi:hypothetical protein